MCSQHPRNASQILLTISTGLNLKNLHEELLQLSTEKLEYFYSLYNIIDASLILMQVVLPPLIACDVQGYNHIAAVTEMLVLVKVAKLSRGNDQMSFLVTMLEEITIDMIPFMLIIFSVLIVTSCANTHDALRRKRRQRRGIYVVRCRVRHHVLPNDRRRIYPSTLLARRGIGGQLHGVGVLH